MSPGVRIVCMVIGNPEERGRLTGALRGLGEVLDVPDAATAVDSIRVARPKVVVLNWRYILIPERYRDAGELFRDLRRDDPRLKIVVGTDGRPHDIRREAVAAGAFDCFETGDADDLRAAVERALMVRKLEDENESLQERLERLSEHDSVIGSSPAMLEISEAVDKAAATDTPVLLRGEPGTGKELLARAIHRRGARRDGPFVTLCSGAVPEHLLEGELFGYEKSFLNGTKTRSRGKLELAEGGTVFLKEIADVPVTHQGHLMKLFPTHGGAPRDGAASSGINARVISSTSANLEKLVKMGSFREDLLERIGATTIDLPPLRDREEDVGLLAEHFLRRSSMEVGKEALEFSREALGCIHQHRWPGNVRELENKVKRAVLITRGSTINPSDLGFAGSVPANALSLKEARRELDMRYIRLALQKTGGNISRAARELGITRVCLHDLLNKYALRKGA